MPHFRKRRLRHRRVNKLRDQGLLPAASCSSALRKVIVIAAPRDPVRAKRALAGKFHTKAADSAQKHFHTNKAARGARTIGVKITLCTIDGFRLSVLLPRHLPARRSVPHRRDRTHRELGAVAGRRSVARGDRRSARGRREETARIVSRQPSVFYGLGSTSSVGIES
jgi:hypothetical protein